MPTLADRSLLVATYADDMAILSTSALSSSASSLLQTQLDELEKWLDNWNIVVNKDKSSHVTFSLRKGDCSSVCLHNVPIPSKQEVSYLGMKLDRRLCWKPHIASKRKEVKVKRMKMTWLLGSKSKLQLRYKLLLYKTILKPIWTYGIQLWGRAAKSNIKILQREQNLSLRFITGAPWYVTNINIHRDLNMPMVAEEVRNYSTRYSKRVEEHVNPLAANLLNNSGFVRMFKRHNPLDSHFINKRCIIALS